MSVLNQSGEEQVECPLCMEPLEVDDLHFYPCTCGYQICRFCWNRIREGENGLCPACRKAYPENPADFTPLSQEQVAAIKTEKKAREQKRRNKTLESRRALANVRVVQNNLVFVVGLPVRLADPEILKRQEYFGKYGKIHKVVINQSTTYAGSQGPSASAYVTYVTSADALRAIQGVNNVTLDGRVLKGSLGTTKYCAHFMKNQPCPKPDCMYLHELGDPKASFTKEEMHAGMHQVYERKLHNQLLSREKEDRQNSGSSSTNAEKGSSKDGQSNFIPTTVVTSSHINVVNSSRSKKDSSTSSGSASSSSSSSGKEAWPSLGTSPTDSEPIPKPPGQSQENGTPESSSPTQQPQSQTASNKNGKDNHTESTKTRNKDSTKKNKSTEDQKAKQKSSNSISKDTDPLENDEQPQIASVFEHETQQNYLTNELDELESDRHSLLENHDLLDNSDHSLLDDDNTHNLLNDANNEVLMMQRHREMLAGLVDSNHMMPPHMKSPITNGYGLLDRDSVFVGNDRQISQMNQGLLEQKEMLMREHSRNEMLMRQSEMLRQHGVMMEPKHYMPTSSIGLESASDLLGANYHPNHNMLPFGMRVDSSITNHVPGNSMSTNPLAVNSLSANPLAANLATNSMSANMGANSMSANLGINSMSANSMAANMGANSMATNMGANSMAVNMGANTMAANMGANPMSANLTANSMSANMGVTSMSPNMGANSMSLNSMAPFLMHNQQMMQSQQQQMQQSMVNGFDGSQNSTEGRYLAENMDKFFTDFHKAQQMRLMLGGGERAAPRPRNMLSAERLEMEHKQRLGVNAREMMGGRAAGDADDDLDFDPFKETQKALAEMMETELMQGGVSGDNMERIRRSRLPPPGFGHVSGFGMPAPRQQQQDWTQMDPAIVSTSARGYKPPHELFARFNQMGMQPVNGTKMAAMGSMGGANNGGALWAGGPAHSHKLWAGASRVPLPPGFAPPTTAAHHPPECIDAK